MITMQTINFNRNSSATVHTFDTVESVAKDTASLIADGTIAISGGSTYASVCTYWSKQEITFNAPLFFPVDERVVPFADSESNWGMIYKSFLKPKGFNKQKEHHVSSVDDYKQLLMKTFNSEIPVFDTIFLGVGNDGHTASLFPGGNYLTDTQSIVLATTSPKSPQKRITLSPTVIAQAKKCVVIIAGEKKRTIVKGLFNKIASLPIVSILSLRNQSDIYIHKELIH